MPDSQMDKLTDLLQSFDHAMLVTQRHGDLRSRPMVIGDVSDDGRVRFIARDDSAKLEELDEHSQVNVTAQGGQKFLSLTGNARISKSRELIDKAWRSGKKLWLSTDKDDPHVIAIEIIPTYAEYWDGSEKGAVTQVMDELRQSGSSSGDSRAPGEQGKVDFRDKPV